MPRATVIAVTALALAVACSTSRQAAELQVRTEYEPGTDFSQWKTFRVASDPSLPHDAARHPYLERTVRDALVVELEARGYQRADDGTTDFRVAFELVFHGTTVRDGLESTHGVDTGPSATTSGKPTAMLAVKMLHPATSQVLWQGELGGLAVDAVSQEATMRKAVWRVLVEFPPLTR
ncbi:MAG TPA: DUF4136 domain-containing protein [Thermoanaerobaculales bacterium]|nr:DUF4136 domain-containing protein [Thermoanaerobaculales bacterium]HPA80671.1 DUF4136 domain-containing protein [Thermoanaerobaculales bacterium]HQL29121.1 DUF4136 domain-containing protein [Thermoanaerobaculales bacterium]HQN95043.1 DUF4136 domain-containing protein [Thermoanaerobaculales bacterium]HQP43031.1 DUF4136 domain-containing protein [Thermoanaerobaculales bacterium]